MQTVSETLRERVAQVARLRKDAAIVAGQMAKAQAALDETPEARLVAAARETARGIAAALAQAEEDARSFALAVYDETMDKRPMPGVEIKEFAVVEYRPADALAWCRANAPNLLVLDAKRFERGLRDGALDVPSEVAQMQPEPRAFLASDLSEYEAGA